MLVKHRIVRMLGIALALLSIGPYFILHSYDSMTFVPIEYHPFSFQRISSELRNNHRT